MLCGLGGVGKTQLAARWAREAWQAGEVDLLVWVTAGAREGVESVYAQAAHEIDGTDPADPPRAATHFLSWLHRTRKRWMIVLDDLTDPADLRGLWPPDCPQGRVVVTTRRRDAALLGQRRTLVEVATFAPQESLAYLQTKLAAHGFSQPDPEAAALASELGHLPLALAQAAAYIADQGMTCGEYRRRLWDRRRSLTDLLPDASGLPDDHRETVAAVWELSIEHANRLRPRGLARPLLELASVLDSNGIPASVLTTESACTYAAASTTPAPVDDLDDQELPDVRDEDAEAALRSLDRLSLISLAGEGDQRSVRVHALVQRVTRESLPSEHFAETAYFAGTALLQAWLEALDGPTGPPLRALRDNIDALQAVALEDVWEVGGYHVLLRGAQSYGEAGMVSEAVERLRSLYECAVRKLGYEHEETIKIRTDLGYWQSRDAMYAKDALEDLGGALAGVRQRYGDDHMESLRIRGHLAVLVANAGYPRAAWAMFAELIEKMERNHPFERTRIIEARFQEAFYRGVAYEEPGQVDVLADIVAELRADPGADYELRIWAAHNLASLRGEFGDLDGAIAELEEVLLAEMEIRGADHPETQTTRHNLAQYRAAAGDVERAVAELESLLSDRRRTRGDSHPATANTRRALMELRAGDITPRTGPP
ncbi:tetratricopeptide repeat protein [Streptomyces sviceus]|uniref:tetratricopeptide repeat protein n=1 Tax=Streptomyces sviceus TaxID=285530 RepID=UPI0036F1355E